MPMDYSRYPDNWKQISLNIRERAGWRCEWCNAPNHHEIVRSSEDGDRYIWLHPDDLIYHTPYDQPWRLSEIPDEFDISAKHTRVVLTVAHLGEDHEDGTPGDKHDKHDCRGVNLAALCQRCHLIYDIEEHMENRRETLAKRKAEAIAETGQLSLFD